MVPKRTARAERDYQRSDMLEQNPPVEPLKGGQVQVEYVGCQGKPLKRSTP